MHGFGEAPIHAAFIYHCVQNYRAFLRLPENKLRQERMLFISRLKARIEAQMEGGGRDKGHWHDFIEREYLVHLRLDDSGGKCHFVAGMKNKAEAK